MAECRSGDRNPRCAEPPIPGRSFCAGHLAQLNLVKAAMKKRDPAKPIKMADTAPKSRPSMCRIIGCVRPPHDASTDGRACWAHRITAAGTAEIQNSCQIDGCHRTATSSAGRCKTHPVKLDGVAQAA